MLARSSQIYKLIFQLASGIISDVKTVLQDFDNTQDNKAFWQIMENALGKYICIIQPLEPWFVDILTANKKTWTVWANAAAGREGVTSNHVDFFPRPLGCLLTF